MELSVVVLQSFLTMVYMYRIPGKRRPKKENHSLRKEGCFSRLIWGKPVG
jgi:hypothetical protein